MVRRAADFFLPPFFPRGEFKQVTSRAVSQEQSMMDRTLCGQRIKTTWAKDGKSVEKKKGGNQGECEPLIRGRTPSFAAFAT